MSIQRAVDDHMGQEQRRFQRPPDDVEETATPVERAFPHDVRRAEPRVHEDRHVELCGFGPEWIEALRRRILAVDLPADGRTAGAELGNGVLELLRREVRIG